MSSVTQLRDLQYQAIVSAPTARAQLRVVNDTSRQTSACDLCRLNTFCLPQYISGQDRSDLSALVIPHRRVQAGESLYRNGQPFTHLYLIKTGAFKTVVLLDDGREQITGFRLSGDTLAIDAISSATHPSEAIALEDAHVCAISVGALMRLSQRAVSVQHHLHRLLGNEVIREQEIMLLLGRMQAEERVAAFLLNLSTRYEARGYSPSEFTLPMARDEIGNYLGLTLETVSRCFSKFKKAGLLSIENRRTRILNHDWLRKVIGARERMH
jgi:CRP/FNR family transcriptional regulator